jgi:signal transduction histidine kinase
MEDDALLVSVQDNGLGFKPGLPASAADGLINMRERMARLGGDCEITSETGRGTRVIFRLPLSARSVAV